MSMLGEQDYYEILEIPFLASQQAVKKAYRRLALKYHPDRNPHDERAEERFKKISEAYTVLSNPQKRLKYDARYVPRQQGKGINGASEEAELFGVEISNELLRDVFKDVFGYPLKERRKAQQGETMRYHLSIPFEVAMLGKDVDLEIPYHRTCPTCGGLRSHPGTGVKRCPRCKGKGRISYTRQGKRFDRTCVRCDGERTVVVYPCVRCRGKGYITVHKSLTLTIPPGTETGSRLRIPGKGYPGLNGGSAGDLYIVVNVEPHPFLERKGNDLIYHTVVSARKAKQGACIEVPTLEGRVTVAIPPGTCSGEVIRIKREGVPYGSGKERGDQLVIVEVGSPKSKGRTFSPSKKVRR